VREADSRFLSSMPILVSYGGHHPLNQVVDGRALSSGPPTPPFGKQIRRHETLSLLPPVTKASIHGRLGHMILRFYDASISGSEAYRLHIIAGLISERLMTFAGRPIGLGGRRLAGQGKPLHEPQPLYRRVLERLSANRPRNTIRACARCLATKRLGKTNEPAARSG